MTSFGSTARSGCALICSTGRRNKLLTSSQHFDEPPEASTNTARTSVATEEAIAVTMGGTGSASHAMAELALEVSPVEPSQRRYLVKNKELKEELVDERTGELHRQLLIDRIQSLENSSAT